MLTRLIIATLLITLSNKTFADSEPKLLEPEQAFQVSAQLDLASRKNIWVTIQIAEGYYLYRNKLRFQTDPKSVALGKPALPKGKVVKDKIFGPVEVYRQLLTFKVPIQKRADESFTLLVQSQGCADVGVCYQPIKSKFRISTLPDAELESPAGTITRQPASILEPPAPASSVKKPSLITRF